MQAFHDVLQYYKETGDLDSQSRALYEIAYAESERGNFAESAVAQHESGLVAAQAQNSVAERIAYISRDQALRSDALAKANLSQLPQLAAQFKEHTAVMRALAENPATTSPTAKRWVSNALADEAKTAIELARLALQSNHMEEARMQQKAAVDLCDEVINDVDGYLAELNETRALPEIMQSIKDEATNLL